MIVQAGVRAQPRVFHLLMFDQGKAVEKNV